MSDVTYTYSVARVTGDVTIESHTPADSAHLTIGPLTIITDSADALERIAAECVTAANKLRVFA